MRRRDFVIGVTFALVAQRARAQQPPQVYRIAVVSPAAPVDWMTETGGSLYNSYRALFRRLRELGYIEGQNLAVERFSGEGRTEHFAEFAAKVVRSNPDVIVVSSSRLTLDIKASTHTIPIVAAAADPVAYGIVPSLARPGGNITGVTPDSGVEMWGKRLELLREMVPGASRVGYLASPRVWEAPTTAVLRTAAQRMKISLIGPPLGAPSGDAEYRRVIAAMAQAGAEALIVSDQPEHDANRRLIVELTAEARLATLYAFPSYAIFGGLMAYGPDFADLFRHAAEQIDQILKGTKPGDIPFYQPTKFELVINVKTAKTLGITVPPTLLIAADELIE